MNSSSKPKPQIIQKVIPNPAAKRTAQPTRGAVVVVAKPAKSRGCNCGG